MTGQPGRPRRGRRLLGRARRASSGARAPREAGPTRRDDPEDVEPEDEWDRTVEPEDDAGPEPARAPLSARALALLGDPRVDGISSLTAARALGVPRHDALAALDALVAAGQLERDPAAADRYVAPPATKAHLEAMFQETALELGEHAALARLSESQLAELDDDEPRLPITAGLLSLFLPGTGQLLNGDVGRASLVFAVWSLAWITHLSPVWTFVCLYAGAEAFFTAKIRGMERKLAREAAAASRERQLPPALPPKPTT